MRHILFISQLFILTNVFSQETVPYRKLIGTYNANQQCNSALISNDSFFYIAGSDDNNSYGKSNFFLVKVNQSGDTLWTQNWGGVNVDDYLKCITETSDNNLVLLGTQKSRTPNNSSKDLYVSKNSKENGEVIWFQQYGGEEDEIPESLIQTSDNGYIILSTVRASTGNQSILIKIDSKGNRLWTKSLSQLGNIKGSKLLALKNDNFAFIGTIKTYEGGDKDIIFIKFNQGGEVILKKIYNEKLNEQPFDIIQLTDNGFIIAGKASSIDRFNFNYNGFFLRIDSTGIIKWYKTWNKVHVRSVIQTDDGNIAAGCSFQREGSYNSLACKFSIDDGSKIWSKFVGDEDWESNASDIIELLDNSLVFFGNTRKSTGFYYILMSKLNADGTWSE